MLGASDCERLRDGPLAQPVNALTSLAYLPAGAWIAWRAARHHGRRRLELVAVAAGLATAGLGSYAYHGPQPGWAKPAHDLPIWALVATLVAHEGLQLRVPTEPAPGIPHSGKVAATAGVGALGAYALGRTGSPACCPDCAWQWHGAWHVLGALALTALAVHRVEGG